MCVMHVRSLLSGMRSRGLLARLYGPTCLGLPLREIIGGRADISCSLTFLQFMEGGIRVAQQWIDADSIRLLHDFILAFQPKFSFI